MDRTEIAWAAGFFDGEGCTFQTSHDYPGMSVSQNDRRPLDRFQAAVGGFGKIREVPYSMGRSGTWFEWRLHGWERVRVVTCLLWPYLSDPKKDQANVIWDQFEAMRRDNPAIGQGKGQYRRIRRGITSNSEWAQLKEAAKSDG